MQNVASKMSSECPSGPVRQLSLQQQPTRRHHHIRRQRSTDDEKYSSNHRSKFSSTKFDDKPKLRIAWVENRPKSREHENEQVQIVAQQISGKSRPLLQKTSKKSGTLVDKASILYSHQELAERLRLAWKHREERKSNINIFLARNTVEERCDSQLSTFTTSTAPSTPILPKHNAINNNECNNNDKFRIYVPSYGNASVPNNEDVKISNISNEDIDDEKDDEKENELLRKKDSVEEKSMEKKKTCPSAEATAELQYLKSPPKLSPNLEDCMSQAKLKRAGFRSGMNKAFVGPIIETPPLSKSESFDQKDETAFEVKLRRTASSAPSQRRSPKINHHHLESAVEKRIPNEKPIEEKDSMSVITTCDEEPIKAIVCNRPMKSAPLKRRIKCSSKRRGFSIGSSKEGNNHARMKGNRNKLLADSKSNDVVTMVSLVSSADSESDADEHTDDKLIHELRNKLPTTPIIKSSVRPPSSATLRRPIKSVSFHQDSFSSDCILKTDVMKDEKKIHPPVSNTTVDIAASIESNPTAWKTTETGNLALPLLQIPQDVDDNTELPLTEREKRCLVVPIADLRDKKRKLQRTRSAGPRLIEMPCPPINFQETYSQLRILPNNTIPPQSATTMQDVISAKVAENSISIIAKLDSRVNAISSEPLFQTTKEKECWHLYRRMCDKGVCVSFDTVLRGMLTPTEYRLRQKEISQNV